MNGKNGRTNVHIDFMKGLHKLCGFPRALWFSLSVMVCTLQDVHQGYGVKVLREIVGLYRIIFAVFCNYASGYFWTPLSKMLLCIAACPFAKEISRCVASELMACGGPWASQIFWPSFAAVCQWVWESLGERASNISCRNFLKGAMGGLNFCSFYKRDNQNHETKSCFVHQALHRIAFVQRQGCREGWKQAVLWANGMAIGEADPMRVGTPTGWPTCRPVNYIKRLHMHDKSWYGWWVPSETEWEWLNTIKQCTFRLFGNVWYHKPLYNQWENQRRSMGATCCNPPA